MHRPEVSEKETILVVEDEPKILRLVQQYLEREGYRVLTADNGDTAIQRFYRESPHLVILDLMIPGIGGLDVARAIRRHSPVPVIILTALAEEQDRLTGLDLGADDYVVKPFSPRELVARVRAVLRRTGGGTVPGGATTDAVEPPIHAGDLSLDPTRREVRLAGNVVTLTSYQFDLLALLARRSGRVFTRMQLVEAVQGETYQGYERTIDAHMKNIRRALGEDARNPRYIETIRGVGYRFMEHSRDHRSERG
ncbi:MAG: DNA-binding response regulator [Spirochaetaceae bacterium]|nr:MAG: DNA-binding response regulator [Spirochaetaceae bacterium]